MTARILLVMHGVEDASVLLFWCFAFLFAFCGKSGLGIYRVATGYQKLCRFSLWMDL